MSAAERDRTRNESTILSRQHGLITRDQAIALGISPSAITRRVATARWERVLPRVYRSTSVPPSALQHLFAALLWAGDESVLSHRSAGMLWRLGGVTTVRAELWVPRADARRAPNVVLHRGAVDTIDRRLVDGMWVTSPARTLVDLAGVLDCEALETAVEDAFRRGLTTPSSVGRRLDALGGKGRAGSGALRALLDDRGSSPALESRLEVRLWRLLRSAGLRPVRQHSVRYEGRTYRLDFAWPALRVAVECNGYDAHGASRRAFERDQTRLATLAAYGWRVVPVTWKLVTEQPAEVVTSVAGALHAAAA